MILVIVVSHKPGKRNQSVGQQRTSRFASRLKRNSQSCLPSSSCGGRNVLRRNTFVGRAGTVQQNMEREQAQHKRTENTDRGTTQLREHGEHKHGHMSCNQRQSNTIKRMGGDDFEQHTGHEPGWIINGKWKLARCLAFTGILQRKTLIPFPSSGARALPEYFDPYFFYHRQVI